MLPSCSREDLIGISSWFVCYTVCTCMITAHLFRMFLFRVQTDLRKPEQKPVAFTVGADVEALAWDPHDPHSFAVSAEDGTVTIFDERQGNEPIETIVAHSKATTSLSYSPCHKGVLVTGSTDATVKLWKGDNGAHEEVVCQKMGVGAVFSAEYCRDSPLLIAAGGANGTITVFDTSVVG